MCLLRRARSRRAAAAVLASGIALYVASRSRLTVSGTLVDSSTTRRYVGTGLGLTISTHLVGMMNGRIWVESTPGLGSQFHVVATFGELESALATVRTPDLADLRGLPVLVVDDNTTNCRILRDLLVYWGMVPTVVERGDLALIEMQRAVERGTAYPLVLLDHQMPEMSGKQVAEHIRRSAALAPTVLLMLSSTDQHSGDQARALGISASLTKPVRRAALLQAILAAFGRSTQHAAAQAVPLPAAPAMTARTLTVLLAEDNAAVAAPLDMHAVLERVAGDRELLADLIALFRQDAPTSLADMRRAAVTGDAPALCRAAHKLRGSVLNFAAHDAAQALLALEAAAGEALPADVDVQLGRVEREMHNVLSAMDRIHLIPAP